MPNPNRHGGLPRGLRVSGRKTRGLVNHGQIAPPASQEFASFALPAAQDLLDESSNEAQTPQPGSIKRTKLNSVASDTTVFVFGGPQTALDIKGSENNAVAPSANSQALALSTTSAIPSQLVMTPSMAQVSTLDENGDTNMINSNSSALVSVDQAQAAASMASEVGTVTVAKKRDEQTPSYTYTDTMVQELLAAWKESALAEHKILMDEKDENFKSICSQAEKDHQRIVADAKKEAVQECARCMDAMKKSHDAERKTLQDRIKELEQAAKANMNLQNAPKTQVKPLQTEYQAAGSQLSTVMRRPDSILSPEQTPDAKRSKAGEKGMEKKIAESQVYIKSQVPGTSLNSKTSHSPEKHASWSIPTSKKPFDVAHNTAANGISRPNQYSNARSPKFSNGIQSRGPAETIKILKEDIKNDLRGSQSRDFLATTNFKSAEMFPRDTFSVAGIENIKPLICTNDSPTLLAEVDIDLGKNVNNVNSQSSSESIQQTMEPIIYISAPKLAPNSSTAFAQEGIFFFLALLAFLSLLIHCGIESRHVIASAAQSLRGIAEPLCAKSSECMGVFFDRPPAAFYDFLP